jgi:hypothetical protein
VETSLHAELEAARSKEAQNAAAAQTRSTALEAKCVETQHAMERAEATIAQLQAVQKAAQSGTFTFFVSHNQACSY